MGLARLPNEHSTQAATGTLLSLVCWNIYSLRFAAYCAQLPSDTWWFPTTATTFGPGKEHHLFLVKSACGSYGRFTKARQSSRSCGFRNPLCQTFWNPHLRTEQRDAVKRLPEPDGRLRYLDTDEIDRLLAACPPHMHPIVTCALHTGMRRGEILGLTWDRVDMKQRFLHLMKTKTRKGRTISISHVQMGLRELRATQAFLCILTPG